MAPPSVIEASYTGGRILVTPTGVIGDENFVEGVSRVIGVEVSAPTASYVTVDLTLAHHVIARPGLRLTSSSAVRHSLPPSIVLQDSEIQMSFSTDFERFPQNRELIVRQMRQQEGTLEHREGFQAFQYVAPRDPEIVRVALHQDASFSSGENQSFHQRVLRTLSASSSHNSSEVRAVVCQFAHTCPNRELLQRLAVAVGMGTTLPPQRSLSPSEFRGPLLVASARNMPPQPHSTLLTTQDVRRGDSVDATSPEETRREMVMDEGEYQFPRGGEIFGFSPAIQISPMARYFAPILYYLNFIPARSEDLFKRSLAYQHFPPRSLGPEGSVDTIPASSAATRRGEIRVIQPVGSLGHARNFQVSSPSTEIQPTIASQGVVAVNTFVEEATPPDVSGDVPHVSHPHSVSPVSNDHPTQVAANDNALGDPAQTVFVGAPPIMYSSPSTRVTVARFVPANNNADGQVSTVSEGDGEFAQSQQGDHHSQDEGSDDDNHHPEESFSDQTAAA